jgi:hypothetical protein
MKVAPDHDWRDHGDLPASLQPNCRLTKVLGLELRDTFASVVGERLPEAWAGHLKRLEAATAPLQPRVVQAASSACSPTIGWSDRL